MNLLRKLQNPVRNVSSSSKRSYEDLDGLVTALGIISALVFSFAVSLQYQVTPRNLQAVDFKTLLCKYTSFRQEVVDVMKKEDLGRHKTQHFNFSISLGGGERLNIEEQLMVKIGHRFGNHSHNGIEPGNQYWGCMSDRAVSVTAESILPHFPMTSMITWATWHKPFLYSVRTEWYGAIATCLLLGSLVWSVVLYISLSLGPSREAASGHSLTTWAYVGIPALSFGYIMLLGGLIMFFIAHTRALLGESSFFEASSSYLWDLFFSMTVPVLVVGKFLAMLSFIVSWTWCKQNNELLEEVDQIRQDKLKDEDNPGSEPKAESQAQEVEQDEGAGRGEQHEPRVDISV